MEQQPTLVERFADNGGHSHWDLIDASNGELLWSGDDELYSDQQNKDMGGTRPDHIDPLKNAAWHAVRQFRQLSVDEQMQYFINSGILHGRLDQIQRLTKEVERLKLRCDRAVQFAGSMGGENTRLREELNDLGVKFDKELERWQERDAVELFRRKQLEMDCANQAAEITRLRELLRRSIPVLDRKNRYYTNLLADIDNKLKQ